MKIAFVTQGYPPERVGGVEVYLKGLARALKGEHETLVFTRGVDPEQPHCFMRDETVEGIPVTRLYVDLRRVETWEDTYQRDRVDHLFREYLIMHKPDLVHIHHLGGLSLGMIDQADKLRIPMIMTFHDHAPFCPRGQRIRNDKRVCKNIVIDDCLDCLKPQTAGNQAMTSKLALYLLFKGKGERQLEHMHNEIRRAFGKVSWFIAPSKFHRERIAEMGVPAEKIEVLPCGLDMPLLESIKPREMGKPVRNFGYLGTLTPSKGVEDAIRAFNRMETPDCALHIYGEAVPYHGVYDYDKRLKEIAGKAEVTFHGRYQPEELPQVFETLDALVIPSRWYESYGITIREAFRSGRPVIVSDIGALSESVAHMKTGLRYPPGDVFALAEMMDMLAQNPKLADKLAQRLCQVESLQEHKAKLNALYKRVVNRV